MRVRTHHYDRENGWHPVLSPGVADLIICFGASSYLGDPDPFLELGEAFPGAILTGCSTAGEIHGRELHDESLSVAIVAFASTNLEVASAAVDAETSYEAGRSLAGRLMSREGLSGMFLLSEGLSVNGTALTEGVNDRVGPDVIVTGGLAGDGDAFAQTWVLLDGKPVQGHVVAVGFYGDSIRIGHGSQGGWDIFGPERTITASRGNVLFELDGQPALALYRRYLGELAAGLPATGLLYPLEVTDPAGRKSLVRTILGIDDEAQSLTFAGDMPHGYKARLMQANFDRLLDGAEGAAEHALSRGGPNAQLSIAISCVGRRLVLGERTEDELEATMARLPESIAQIGFYSYGEISPYSDGTCDLHNQTMTLTTLAES